MMRKKEHYYQYIFEGAAKYDVMNPIWAIATRTPRLILMKRRYDTRVLVLQDV